MPRDRVNAWETNVTVGAYARVDVGASREVRTRLADLQGVTLFDLDEPEKVGLIIEADSMNAAHDRLSLEIKHVEGVLGVWPVYADFGET